MKHFGDIMFTDKVRAQQERRGSRKAYGKMTARPAPEALSDREADFIRARDTFYMATVTETGWPYVQHRGGPRGFLRILGPATIGFADYRGNRQFISRGNLETVDRVALILMDYPQQARLKPAGHAKAIDAVDDPELARQLHVEGEGRVERLFVIELEAFDWNCPQYITPRFTAEEARGIVEDHYGELLEENAALKARLSELEST